MTFQMGETIVSTNLDNLILSSLFFLLSYILFLNI